MLSVVYNILFVILILLLVVIGVSVIQLPNNYKIYSVVSGSMEPTIKTGSIVFVKPVKQYSVNDIVTMKSSEPRKTVTHRIITKIVKNGRVSYETKGDANKSADTQELLSQNIIGKVFLTVPYLGYPIGYSKTLPGLIFMIIIPATIIAYGELMNIKNEALRLLKVGKHRKLTAFEEVEEKVGEEIIEVEKEVKKIISKKK